MVAVLWPPVQQGSVAVFQRKTITSAQVSLSAPFGLRTEARSGKHAEAAESLRTLVVAGASCRARCGKAPASELSHRPNPVYPESPSAVLLPRGTNSSP